MSKEEFLKIQTMARQRLQQTSIIGITIVGYFAYVTSLSIFFRCFKRQIDDLVLISMQDEFAHISDFGVKRKRSKLNGGFDGRHKEK